MYTVITCSPYGAIRTPEHHFFCRDACYVYWYERMQSCPDAIHDFRIIEVAPNEHKLSRFELIVEIITLSLQINPWGVEQKVHEVLDVTVCEEYDDLELRRATLRDIVWQMYDVKQLEDVMDFSAWLRSLQAK